VIAAAASAAWARDIAPPDADSPISSSLAPATTKADVEPEAGHRPCQPGRNDPLVSCPITATELVDVAGSAEENM
jgi:hypothetical protein